MRLSLCGLCVEYGTTHLVRHLSLHPFLRTSCADTILRAIEELTCENTTYQSASDRTYDFNTAGKMNRDGNTNVRFNQIETLERIFKRLEASGVQVARAHIDCDPCSEEIAGMVEVVHCKHFISVPIGALLSTIS